MTSRRRCWAGWIFRAPQGGEGFRAGRARNCRCIILRSRAMCPCRRRPAPRRGGPGGGGGADRRGRGVLLARRPEGKKMAGMWEFPGGGKVEPGRPRKRPWRVNCARSWASRWPARCRAFVFASHPYDSFHLLMPVFLCRRWKGEPRRGKGKPWPGWRRTAGGISNAAGRPAADSHVERFSMTPAERHKSRNPTAAILIIGNEILSGRTRI